MKNYYELLELPPTASQEDIKRAFRLQIARYHPDKVHHLGKEFQQMAAERAAELTEAYRVLSDRTHRAEHDRLRGTAPPATPSAGPPPKPAEGTETPAPDTPAAAAAAAAQATAGHGEGWFKQERATRDEYVRKATIGRFRHAFTQTMGDAYDDSPVRGFDLACAPKAKLFGRKGPWVLAQFVSLVDAKAVSDAWAQAAKAGVRSGEEICIFLMGSGMASRGELQKAISEQRRKAAKGAKVTIIPIDARDWDAHIPVDAPALVKDLLVRLKTGA